VRQRHIELPSLDSLPQTVCASCGVSKINGLYSPGQFANKSGELPRCMLCIGEINATKKSRAGQSSYFNPRSINPPHP
jgi:hypothetical protein